MTASAWISFTRWDGLSPDTMKWVGAENYRALPFDPTLRKCLWNSVVYTLMNVPVQMAVGLILALLAHHARRRTSVWATVYYVPHMLGGVAMILIWWWILNPQVGPLNRGILALFDVFGLTVAAGWRTPTWLFSPTWAKPSLVLMNACQSGGHMLVFLAALLRADRVVHEAAMLDGAGAVGRFWRITLPQLSPAILFNATTGVVFSMQAFNQPYLLSNYQQEDSLFFYMVYMYQSAFERHRLGYSGAMSWLLVGVLLAFTVALIVVTRRWIRYDVQEES